MPDSGKTPSGHANALLLLQHGRDPDFFINALEGAGWRVTVADTTDLALAITATHDVGLMVVDADLQVRADGFHPAVALRQQAANDRPPRIVLVAARANAAVEALAAVAGAYRIALVPSHSEDPYEAGQQGRPAEPFKSSYEGDRPSADRCADSGPTIWVVDDSPAIRLLVRRAFQRGGWRVTEFEDLHSTRTELAAGVRPQAVLLDIFLPDGNGLDHIGSFTAAGAAVVMMSDLAGPDQVERAFAAGAIDIVAKPVDMRSLLARVEHAIRRVNVGVAEHAAPPVRAPKDYDGLRLNDLRL